MQIFERVQNIFEDEAADDFWKSREKEILHGLFAAAETVKRVDDVDVQVFHENGVNLYDIWMAEQQNISNFITNGFKFLVWVAVSRNPLKRHVLGRRLVHRQENAFWERRSDLIIAKHNFSHSGPRSKQKKI